MMKTWFYWVAGLAVVLSVAMTGAARAEVAAWWPFDEGTGNVAHDGTGNGNDLTFVGDPEWTDGYLGGAIDFDGSGDYLESTVGPGLAITGEVSMAAWIKLSAAIADQKVGGNQNNSTGGFKMSIYNNLLEFEIRNSSNSSTLNRSVAGGTVLEVDVWYHVIGVYSLSGGYLRTYVNGVLDRGMTTTAVLGASTGPMRIGCEPFTVGSYNFNGIMDDIRVYNHAVTEAEMPGIMAGTGVELAKDPNPEDETTDVHRDVVLSWTAGKYAVTHDVYLGTSFDDVNDATQPADNVADAAYDPEGLLEYGKTYYWRVDEVNGAPDYTAFKGKVWGFTVEQYAYPIPNVTAKASAEQTTSPAARTVDGSGLDELDQHGTDLKTVWATPGGLPAWIEFTFEKEYKLHELWVWNANSELELFMGFGAKGVAVEYSTDGETWTPLENVPEFVQGTATAAYTPNNVVDFGDVMAKYVRLTINTTWGATGIASLSEVRFFYVPVQAFEPTPADGATGVSVATNLDWRPGREATSHVVYMGTDANAVADGTVSGQTVTDHTYTPAGLMLTTEYFWKVDEVGDTGTYAGDVWSFTTEEYIVIDDFEKYDDDMEAETTIWHTWIDGLTTEASGSQVGYTDAPFAEKTIVHGGGQSMPLQYNNSTYALSEAQITFDPAQDWTARSIKSLSLYFYGAADNSGQLYIKINNTKISYDGPAINIVRPSWQLWNIDLSAVGNVSSIRSLTIGIEGSGATGILYVDDIRLHPEVLDDSSPDITGAGDTVQGVPNDGDWPEAEYPALAIDDNVNTKYLHRKGGSMATGFQVAPLLGSTIVTGLTLTTANDDYGRDPITFELSGSNASIDGPYTPIASGNIVDFSQTTVWPRFTKNATPIEFANTVPYKFYQLVFPKLRPDNDGLMQIAEVEFIGSVAP